MTELNTYLCSYFLSNDVGPLYFRCQAEDESHAKEQLIDAEPDAKETCCAAYAIAMKL